jgi:RimJ/RimL family protein N-acetyltransferase
MSGELSFPEPLTDGLITLRPFRGDDVPALVRACGDPEIVRWTEVPAGYDDEMARKWIASHRAAVVAGRSIPLAVTDANGEELLGAIELHLDTPEGTGRIGYWLATWARGRGAATRAVRLMTGFAFDMLGLARLEVQAHPDNVRSQRVALNAGFIPKGATADRLEFGLPRDRHASSDR